VEFDTGLFLDALFSWPFVDGALITIVLSVASHGVGIVFGLGIALMSASPRRAVHAAARVYVWFFRGTPVLLLLLFVWNALPQMVPAFREEWFTPFLAAWLALGLSETAYQSEINRAALMAVDDGQRGAAAALGLTRFQAFCLVVLPQCLRVAVPPTVNEFITLLKTTSLASVISLQELLAVTNRASNASFRYVEFYAVALIYYLAIVSVLTLGQMKLERRLNPEGNRLRLEHE
jgi:polar amino acid transport system permease protein